MSELDDDMEYFIGMLLEGGLGRFMGGSDGLK